MKKLYRIFKAQLLIVALLFGANICFAQVVTVPSGCAVKVAGTGGNIALNKVGDGGVVAMPDNYPGGSFSCTVPAGYSQGSWTLKGDLSVVTASSSGSPVQPAGTLSAYSIESYNKFRRPTEGAFGSAASRLAKSKGKVSISYTNGPCNGVGMSFEVYKTYTLPPAIVGPSCLTAGVSCTFSVDRVASDNTGDNIGFDQYYWTGLPPYINGSFYASADNSSITFTPSSIPAAGITIKCCLGRANPWDGGTTDIQALTGTACVTKFIGAEPVAPSISSPNMPSGQAFSSPAVCVNTGISPLILSYPVAPAGTTYAWSTLSNWTISSSTSGTTTTTLVNLDNNSGELKLRVTNSCTSKEFVYKINRIFTSAVAINGTSCITTGTDYDYTIGTGTNATINTAIWSISPTPATGSFNISLNSLTTTATVNASALVPPGQYTLTATSQGFSYNGFPCVGSITKSINVAPATPQFSTPIPTCVVRNVPISSISVDSVPGVTYDWTPLPAGVTCTNCTTANPTFTFNSAATVQSVTLKPKAVVNGCPSKEASQTFIYISITPLIPGGGFNDQYLVNSSCGDVDSWVITTALGSTTYNTTSGNVAISNSGTTGVNNLLTISGTGGSPITQICANLVGGIQVCTTNIGTNTQRPTGNIDFVNELKAKLDDIKIYPNPTKGEFYINVTDYKHAAAAIITDNSGKELGTFELAKGENKIVIGNLAKGIYFVTLLKDGQSEVRQLIIE